MMFSSGILTSILLVGPAGDDDYSAEFTDQTVRMDTFHMGTGGREQVGLDRFRLDGEWAGPRTGLVHDEALGAYRFEVRRKRDDALICAQGYSSIFGEWETTAAAQKGAWMSFHESVRFPQPRHPVQVRLLKRDARGAFVKIFEQDLDPGGTMLDRSPVARTGDVTALVNHGPPRAKVDLVLLADGYRAGEGQKFLKDANRLIKALFALEPFKRRAADFNVWAVHTPSVDSGLPVPRERLWRRTALGASFDTMGSARYVLTYENRAFRDAAAQVPYDTAVILCNTRRYGGGGIFGLYATCAVDNAFADYLFVHEFGHSFTGLGDEYYTSSVAYEDLRPLDVEPWRPNVTAHPERATLKWGDLVQTSTPVPTTWPQEEFDRVSYAYQKERTRLRDENAPEERLEELARTTGERLQGLLRGAQHAGKVGTFEGCEYRGKGLYRPEIDCLMFTRMAGRYCSVCERALEGTIDRWVGK